jgi:hypothetical protein
VYGQLNDFKNVTFGIKIYKFAHEMQIDSLTEALDDFLKQPTASDVIAIFNIFQLSKNLPGLKSCKEVKISPKN